MEMMHEKEGAAGPVGARRGGVHSDDLNDHIDDNYMRGGPITSAIVQQKRAVRQ